MICVSVQEQNFAKCKEILAKSPMVELRADLCKLELDELTELLQSHSNVLITCRIENSSREFAYKQITHAIMKGAKFVDIEIEAPDDHLEFIKSYAKANACKLIISYHNFEGTNSLSELEQIYDLCRRKGADIVKIVTTANTTEDAVRTMALYNSGVCKSGGEGSLIAFAMGEYGKFTRKLCLDLGSPYTYVAADKESATAPGQYTLDEMESLLADESYPFIFNGEDSNKIDIQLPNELSIPCSKSVAQRAILAAALSDGVSELSNFAPCNDINGAIEVVKNLGCLVEEQGSVLRIKGLSVDKLKSITSINIGESGLLTRLLIPFAVFLSGLSKKEVEITGHGSILKRNLAESAYAINSAGANCISKESANFLPFALSGNFTHKEIEFSGKESSQIVSGFLMTLPLLAHDTTLKILNPTSIPYIELTLGVLAQFGIEIKLQESSAERLVYFIKGGQKYNSTNLYMDADWSSAAPFAVAGAIRGDITLLNMKLNSSQADEAILDVLRECGANVEVLPAACSTIINSNINDSSNNAINGEVCATELANIKISVKQKLQPFELDATHCPDLFPILALLALHCNGESKIKGVSRLTQKESNRAESIYSQFTLLGGKIDIKGDTMHIVATPLHGGKVSGYNDHRIAMSMVMASLFVSEQVALDNIKCIDKSFPSFLERLTDK